MTKPSLLVASHSGSVPLPGGVPAFETDVMNIAHGNTDTAETTQGALTYGSASKGVA